MGRSTRVITLEETAQVEAMAAHGHTQEEIAEFLGMSARSFRYKKNENKILIAAYNRGRFKAKNYVASRLWRYIRNDALTAINLSAITFYLRTQAGWTEKQEMNLIAKDVTPNRQPLTVINHFTDDHDEIRSKNG
ncbi:MAG: hypothetical protein EBS33_02065 [Alphaproteobacteria bacterium]|nr:hypothetical protein [Alphaproteobacteria bacterium]